VTLPRKAIIGVVLASVSVLALLSCIGFLFFCSAAWCPNFSFVKIRSATDFVSCTELGFLVMESSPPSCRAGGAVFYADDAARLRVSAPLPQQEIALPFTLAGSVRVGSGTQVHFDLLDQDGFALTAGEAELPKALSGQWIPFRESVSYPRPLGTGGTVEVSMVSPRGTVMEQAKIPVRFLTVASVEVKAFFGNTERDAQTLYCDVSYPVARRIAVSEDVLEASLRELLKGPALQEQQQHFFTSLPAGVEVRSIEDDDGQVRVTFNRALLDGVAGSCRVQAIRSQIERTLKQFPFVTEVTIAVEGMPDEEVLQP